MFYFNLPLLIVITFHYQWLSSFISSPTSQTTCCRIFILFYKLNNSFGKIGKYIWNIFPYLAITTLLWFINKGLSKKNPHFSKFDVQFSLAPLVPKGCPSQDLMYSLVHQVLRRTASWDQQFTSKLHIKFWKMRFFLDNPLLYHGPFLGYVWHLGFYFILNWKIN